MNTPRHPPIQAGDLIEFIGNDISNFRKGAQVKQTLAVVLTDVDSANWWDYRVDLPWEGTRVNGVYTSPYHPELLSNEEG